MLHLRLIKVNTPEEVGKLAADQFEAVIKTKPACVIGLATGSTPLPLYRELIAREKAGKLDFSRVRSANLDEYKGLAPDHPQSYRRFMQENLFDHISIKPENTIVPDGLASDVDAMCAAYERKIEEWGGVDCQLLGIGHDGHIGFNEPCDHFPVMTHEVQLTEMTKEANKRFFNSIDEVPTAAFSMGIGTVMAARKIVMVVTGEDKADIIYKSFFGPVTPEVPASILQFHPDVTLICDAGAAKKLPDYSINTQGTRLRPLFLEAKSMYYNNAMIFTKEGRFEKGSFAVEDGKFTMVCSACQAGEGVDLQGAYVIPGLVDVHIHGSKGADFSDGDYDGLVRMAGHLASCGVTSFAPTSMTLPYDVLGKAYATAVRFRQEQPAGCAHVMGIHMEGPYFSEKKKGAQNGAYLKNPDFEGFEKLYNDCGGLIAIADAAPELEGAAEFAAKASKLCTVSVAHTDSDYDHAKAFYEAGATHLTHMYNAMPSIHHRNPGVIGAAAEREDVVAELICDGFHVHPSAVRMAFKLFPGRMCLISDALRCCGMPDGEYELGGQTVYLRDQAARLKDGTIAGSVTDLYACMRKAVEFGIPREQAILSATIIPAREIGRDQEIGSIEPGKLADFVVCDEKLTRKEVYLAGQKL